LSREPGEAPIELSLESSRAGARAAAPEFGLGGGLGWRQEVRGSYAGTRAGAYMGQRAAGGGWGQASTEKALLIRTKKTRQGRADGDEYRVAARGWAPG
jgi:hypothetical protein